MDDNLMLIGFFFSAIFILFTAKNLFYLLIVHHIIKLFTVIKINLSHF